MSDLVFLRAARFPCCIGVTDAERSTPQEVALDVDLHLDLRRAGATDDIAATVSYTDVWQAIKKGLDGSQFHLIEALAEHVAAELLARFPPVEQVMVRAAKPNAMASRGVGGVGVQVTRRRSGHDG